MHRSRLSVQNDAWEELHELGLQVSSGRSQKCVIPAKTGGSKLRSWVFDAVMEKNYVLASVKDAGIGTSSSWMSKDDN